MRSCRAVALGVAVLVSLASALPLVAHAQPPSPPARPQPPSPGSPPAHPIQLNPQGGVRRPPVPRPPGPPQVRPLPPGQVPPRHEEAKEEESETPKSINWTDFSNKDQPPYMAALINFAILLIIYVSFGKKPIAEALVARRAAVSKQIEEAQQIKREAEARSKQYTAKLQDLDSELVSTKAALEAAGVGEKMRIVKEAEEKAVRMQKDSEFQLAQERKQMQADLQREAAESALAGAEQILRTGLTQADQERVAEEFLATLVPERVPAPPVTGGAS